eukprot:scaffold667_cov117-Cylindrotheca_fusiformis.AAC.3
MVEFSFKSQNNVQKQQQLQSVNLYTLLPLSFIITTTIINSSMDISSPSLSSSLKKMAEPQQSIPVPNPHQITLCVSSHGADVVDPANGSPTTTSSSSSSKLSNSGEEDGVIAAAPETTNEDGDSQFPAEILPEEKVAAANVEDDDDADDDDDDDGSEYSYEDDEDAAFSGFLSSTAAVSHVEAGGTASPARIVEEDTVEEKEVKKKWKEPSKQAVSMSLRAQQETSGSKRRLAQDLYRIMNQDTEESGFSMAPKSEDSMDKWTIKLFQFDSDSKLAKDMLVLRQDHIELEMKFPEHYPYEPPFVRVVKPRFKRQTGFVMHGALCMELLTSDGWNPVNDIETVIVSIRSLLAVGDGRLEAAAYLPEARYEALLKAATGEEKDSTKRQKLENGSAAHAKPVAKEDIGSYTDSEAQAAYSHLSDHHKKNGWDTSGWWTKKG